MAADMLPEEKEKPSAAVSKEIKDQADKRQKKKEKQRRRREKQKLKGKQGKRNTPRPVRLEQAKTWLPSYSGNDIIRAYRKHFAISPECAFEELRLLGVPFTEEYVAKFKESLRLRDQQAHNKKMKRRRRLQEKREARQREQSTVSVLFPDSDDRFFYIAGYTSGGAPYGVTWEEMGIEPYGSLIEEKNAEEK